MAKNDVKQTWNHQSPTPRRENQVIPGHRPCKNLPKHKNGWCAFRDLVVKFGKNIPKNESRTWWFYWKTASSSNYNHPPKDIKQLAFLNCPKLLYLDESRKNRWCFTHGFPVWGVSQYFGDPSQTSCFYFARQWWLGQHLIISWGKLEKKLRWWKFKGCKDS